MATIIVTGDYVVGPAEQMTFSNETAFILSAVQGQPEPRLTNKGTIDVIATSAVRAIRFDSSSLFMNAVVLNDTGGVFKVTAGATSQDVYGVWAGSWAAPFVNRGRFEVLGGGQTVGVLSYSPDQRFTNSGDFIVSGARAYGFWDQNGSHFMNTGLIEVTATSGAANAYISAGSPESFLNSGTIRARDMTAAVDSIAVGLGDVVPYRIVNSGVIEGDFAILHYANYQSSTTLASVIDNTGELRGIVDLSRGPSRALVDNRGAIVGDVRLGAGDDRYLGSSGSLVGSVYGGTGNDTLIGGQDDDVLYGDEAVDSALDGSDLLRGGGGDDQLYGGRGADVLYGEADDDTLFGGFGADTLSGGFGADILYGNQDADVLYGNQDADVIYGGQGNDVAYGGQGDDVVFGNLGDDALYGNLGDDLLNGGAGINRLDGGDGVDTVSYADAGAAVRVSLLFQGSVQETGASTDMLLGVENLTGSMFGDVLTGDGGVNVLGGGAGADQLSGGFGGDTLLGGAGADVLYGNQDDDVLYGNVDSDVLFGGQGADLLYGGEGEDVLQGGLGQDLMNGGAGADVFRFLTLADSPSSGSFDFIEVFETGLDKIDLRALRASGSDSFSIVPVGSSSAYLLVDVGGDGQTDLTVVVVGAGGLSEADVIWS